MPIHCNRTLLSLLLFALPVCAASPAVAAIIGTTGQVVVVAPPTDTRNGVLESNTQILAFAERQNFTLPSGVNVNISVPSTSPSGSSANTSFITLPTGTGVSSFFIHFDSVGTPSPQVAVSGSLTFDTDVLGIADGQGTLDASDPILGLPGSTYGTNQSGRDLEITPGGVGVGANDEITLSGNRRTVTFNFRNGTTPDEVRIVTAPAVPEPATMTLLMFGSIALLRRRRA